MESAKSSGGLAGIALMGALVAFTAQAQTPAATPTVTQTAAPSVAPAPHVYGRLERAKVVGSPSIEIEAQLDGNGDYTVLKAEDIKYASGVGGMYVHFTIDNGNVMPGKLANLVLPVSKDQHVRERNGGVEHRPIVTMAFCIGDRAFTTNVTLEARVSYTPPLVLSKADAAQFGPIDAQKKNTGEPACAPPAAPAPQPAQ